MLTLFEHQKKPFVWDSRLRAALARLNQGKGNDILLPVFTRNGQPAVQATQHVGVVRLGRETIQVLPKIYRHEAQNETEATRSLLHLLSIAGDLPIREHDLAPLLRRQSDWFEILTHLFAAHLTETWQRGILRGYVPCEEEASPTLRGRWRLAAQLRRPERRHVFAVAYDEFTPDNPLNRILRFVVERLWIFTRDAKNRQILGTLRVWMDEVTLLPLITASDASLSSLTRLHPSYVLLLNLARLFLEGGSLQMADGNQETFAFMFDMNRLFESFVFRFLHRHRAQILPLQWQDCALLSQSSSTATYLARRDGRPVFGLAPDIALRAPDGSFPLLLDTKYKHLDNHARAGGVGQADMYQMYAYARRYPCPRVLLLYPQTADITDPMRVRFTLEDGGTIEAATLDLRVELGKPEGVRQLIQELKFILQEPLQL